MRFSLVLLIASALLLSGCLSEETQPKTAELQTCEPITIEKTITSYLFNKTDYFSHSRISPQLAANTNDVYFRNGYTVSETYWSIADGTSMYPTIGQDQYALMLKQGKFSESDLHVGDIISFKTGSETWQHRIIKISADELGWYAVTKGDNNQNNDGKVRFEQVEGVALAILY